MTALIILGGDTASCLVAHTYRKVVRRGEVTLIAGSEVVGYAHVLLPYYSTGLLSSPQLVSKPLLELTDLVQVVRWDQVEVRGLDEVVVRGKAYLKPRLVVSTWPSCEALEGRAVLNLETPEDAEALRERLGSEAREVVVLRGVAALPVVDALLRAGIKPLLVWERGPFDTDVQSFLLEDLREQGVKLIEDLREAPRDLLHVSYAWGRAPQCSLLGVAGPRIRVDETCDVVELPRVKALGCGTEVVELGGHVHPVESEEEALLQAYSCALSLAGFSALAITRYFVARLGGKVYASLGLTRREAERLGTEPSVTRIRGWGARDGTLVKLVSSRGGKLVGAQLVVKAEAADLVGLLYYAVNINADLHDLLSAISPLDPLHPVLDPPLHHAFWALLRKTMMRRLARGLQRLEGSA